MEVSIDNLSDVWDDAYVFPVVSQSGRDAVSGLIAQQIRCKRNLLGLSSIILEERVRIPYSTISGFTDGRLCIFWKLEMEG